MMRPVLMACLAALITQTVPTRSFADPDDSTASEPRRSRQRFYFRAGAATVAPITSSQELELADVDGPASLAVQNGPIAGSGATVDSATIPAAILGYVLPTASRRWSIETVLGVPFTVRFKATGTLATTSIAPTALGIPTGVGPLGSELGEAKAVPPVITLVYQLTEGLVRPYVGAGVSVLFAYDAHVTNPMLTAVGEPEMTIAPAPGVVFQSGLDIRVWKKVYARLDVKFIAFMKARAEVRHIQVETPGLPLFDNVEVGTAKMNIWVNPLIVQGGVGVDF
ncbi:MAG: OmpW family protein [Myxococcales bacterium]|nr:OmpW family protein [Myxococcales bacterium]